jgi:hypothetical protein
MPWSIHAHRRAERRRYGLVCAACECSAPLLVSSVDGSLIVINLDASLCFCRRRADAVERIHADRRPERRRYGKLDISFSNAALA